MNIPEKVRIGGVDYAVGYVKDLNNGINMACGHIDYGECKLELSADEDPNNQAKCLTLLHEIFHGLGKHFDDDFGKDEKLVDMLARGTYMVLEDNIQNLYDLSDRKGQEDAFLWHPISEGLPDKKVCVRDEGKFVFIPFLCTTRHIDHVVMCEYLNGDFYMGSARSENITSDVIAWAPLPERYEEH